MLISLQKNGVYKMEKYEKNREKTLFQFILVHRVKTVFPPKNTNRMKRNKTKQVGRTRFENNIDRNIGCKNGFIRTSGIRDQTVEDEIFNKKHKIILDQIIDLKKSIEKNSASIEVLKKSIETEDVIIAIEKQPRREHEHLLKKTVEISMKIDEIMNLIERREKDWSKSFQTVKKILQVPKTALENKENHLQVLNDRNEMMQFELENISKELNLSKRLYDESVMKNKGLQDQIEKAEKKLNDQKCKISEAENEYQKILLTSNKEKKKLLSCQIETKQAEEKLASIYREIDLALKRLNQNKTDQKPALEMHFKSTEKTKKIRVEKSAGAKKFFQEKQENEKDLSENKSEHTSEDELRKSALPNFQLINQAEVVKNVKKSWESEAPVEGSILDDRETVAESESLFDKVCEEDLKISTDEEVFEKSTDSDNKFTIEDEHQKSILSLRTEIENKSSNTSIELASKDRLIRVMRTEKKYLISLYKAIALANKLDRVLFADLHNGIDGYYVRSLYFDSVDDRDYYAKEDGLLIRKKIRLRVYSPNDDLVKLEKKEKHGDNQCKRSLNISRETARQMIQGNYDELFKNPHSFAQELYYDLVTGGYVPKCMVEYRRKAFIVPENDTRITIDSNIFASESSFDLFDESFNGYPISHCDDVTLEVKYNNFLLTYVKDLLDSCQKNQVSYGKYYLGRSVGHGKYALLL